MILGFYIYSAFSFSMNRFPRIYGILSSERCCLPRGEEFCHESREFGWVLRCVLCGGELFTLFNLLSWAFWVPFCYRKGNLMKGLHRHCSIRFPGCTNPPNVENNVFVVALLKEGCPMQRGLFCASPRDAPKCHSTTVFFL